MEEKVFKTLDELVDILISRGVNIADDPERSYAKRVLEKHGYYNLVNGYSKLFLTNKEDTLYKSGTTLPEMNALYQFDRVLRNIFLDICFRTKTHS